MKRLIGSLQVMVLLGYLVACTGATSTVIPTPTIPSTSTKIPTATETATLFPTNTPFPSPTPACPPQPDSQVTLNAAQENIATLVPDAKVTWYDNFKCEDMGYGWYGWEASGNNNPTTKVNVSNSIVTFSAQKVKNIWNGMGRTANSLGDQKGFLVLFRYQAKTTANLFFHTGTWQASDYRRWGLSTMYSNEWQGWQGFNWLHSSISSKILQPDTWYYLLVMLDKRGQVTMKVWEKDDPTNRADFKKVMPSSWIGHQWGFMVQVYEGTLEMDEYQELSFDTP